MATLLGMFGLRQSILTLDGTVNQVPFDKVKSLAIPISAISNAQVRDAGTLTPEECAMVLKMVHGVNLSFNGYYVSQTTKDRRGETVRTAVQTEKLEKGGWMFFTGRAPVGKLEVSDEMLAKVREALKK